MQTNKLCFLLLILNVSSSVNSFAATVKKVKSTHSNKCFCNYHATDVHPLLSSTFMVPSSLCSVASFHMQVHLARDSVALTAEWPNGVPRARPLCSRSPGANPLPCLPASVHMSSYGRHMWSCRKADAVFPFVKSSFWKAVSILRARVESVSECKGERAVKRQQAQLYCAECCSVWSLWGYADLAKRWHVIILCVNTCVSHSSTYSTKTHTRTVLMWTCL